MSKVQSRLGLVIHTRVDSYGPSGSWRMLSIDVVEVFKAKVRPTDGGELVPGWRPMWSTARASVLWQANLDQPHRFYGGRLEYADLSANGLPLLSRLTKLLADCHDNPRRFVARVLARRGVVLRHAQWGEYVAAQSPWQALLPEPPKAA